MRPTAITIPWADGEYTFDLRLKEVRSLQDKTGFGCGVLLSRLQSDHWKVDDFRETILQGLIGGGMEPIPAAALVRQYVDDRPAKESLLPAAAILMAWIMGAPPGKNQTPTIDDEAATVPVASTSESSMEPERR